jgi:zinc protease
VRSTSALIVIALATPAFGQQVDRAARPGALPAAPFKFPAIHTHRLANGVRLLVVEDHSVPVVAVRAIVGADSTWDPAGKEGLYAVTLGALREGSTTRSGDDLAQAAATIGTSVVSTGFTTVSAAFAPAFGLMAEMLTRPAFDSAGIERRKSTQAAAARRVAQAPVTIPRHLFYELVYGDMDPFVRSLLPTEASIRSITRADVVHFYDSFFSPRTTTLAITGDLSDSAALDAATQAFGAWRPRREQSIPHVINATDHPLRTHIYVRDVPGAGEQAYLYVGELGPSRIDPDAVATEAFAAIASARLQEMLREKRSFIYSSTTGITWRRAHAEGTFVGSTTVSAQKVDSALTEWLRILRELRTTRPPTQGELDAVRRSRVGALAARIDGPDSIVTRLAEMAREELPLDYHERYVAQMSSVSLADLSAAAARHVDLDHLVIVVTGNARVLEPVLRAAKLAPVTVVSAPRGSAP